MDENEDTTPDGLEARTASPGETRKALLRKQARGYTVVRNVLVQRYEPDEGGSRGSTLARIVHEGKHRALLLYLLLLGAWAELKDREEPLQADVWIRALTGPAGRRTALTWSRSTLSRAWVDLEQLGLVKRSRVGRLVHVMPCREDGGGEPYDAPAGRDDWQHVYFVLPDAFWDDDGLFAQLSLPGLAMFLLLAKETNKDGEKHFTFEQIKDWYGIKRRTAQNGIKNLRDVGVLHTRREPIAAPLSPTGRTVRTWYDLTGEYGHLARRALRQTAKTELRSRTATAQGATTPSKNSRPAKARRLRKKKQ